MPSVLKHTECPACRTRHHFCLPAGDVAAGRGYAFVCPVTGDRAVLTAAAPGEAAAHSPQGAVELVALGEAHAAR